MTQTETRDFAFGGNNHDDCPCPALAAGYNPASRDMSIDMAEKYDEILQKSPSDKGVVDEQTAKEVWFNVIAYFEFTACQTEDPYYEEVASVGRDIADELGW